MKPHHDPTSPGQGNPDMPGRVGRVVVVGSINADWVVEVPALPTPGDTVVGTRLSRQHGGKGANQAAAAAGCGVEVLLIAAVGDDAAADDEIAALEAVGVCCLHVRRVVGATTGLAMITVDRGGENQIVVAAGANALLTADDMVESLNAVSLTPADVLLASNEIPFEAVEAAVVAGAAAESRVVHNPAPARPLSVMTERITLLTPNRSEAVLLTGAQSVEEAAVQLARSSGAPVAVTVGPDGAILAKPSRQDVELRRIPTAQCQPIDTVGAGDMFNGVTAAALARGRDLATAVSEGVLAATASTQWHGARAPSPTS